MKDANLDDLISESKIIVHSGRYAYLQAKETEIKNHFLVVKDEDETTVITEEKYFSETEHQNHVKWFKLFEIKLAAPFVGVWFIAKVTKKVADKKACPNDKGIDLLLWVVHK